MNRTLIVFSLAIYILFSCSPSEDKKMHQHSEEHSEQSEDAHSHEEDDNQSKPSVSLLGKKVYSESKSKGGSKPEIVFEENEFADQPLVEIQNVETVFFSEIIHTSGKIKAAQGDKVTITSNGAGKFINSSVNLLPGIYIKKGEILGYVSGSTLIDDNTTQKYTNAKLELNKAKSDFNRAKQLISDTIISQKEFQQYKLVYNQAQTNYNVISKVYSKAGIKIIAPKSGYLQDIIVTAGEFIEVGGVIAVMAQNKRLIIEAEVPQKEITSVKNISSINFKTDYSEKVFNSEKLNGRIVSIGGSLTDNYMLPVIFEIDNTSGIIAGSFIEVWIKVEKSDKSIVVPNSAIIEEQGIYSVFLETGRHTYRKVNVGIGSTDGEFTKINNGLSGNEKVVTKGAIRIKLASMSSALPSHGHSH